MTNFLSSSTFLIKGTETAGGEKMKWSDGYEGSSLQAIKIHRPRCFLFSYRWSNLMVGYLQAPPDLCAVAFVPWYTWQMDNKLSPKRRKLQMWKLPIKDCGLVSLPLCVCVWRGERVCTFVCVCSCMNNEAFQKVWHISVSPGTQTQTVHTHSPTQCSALGINNRSLMSWSSQCWLGYLTAHEPSINLTLTKHSTLSCRYGQGITRSCRFTCWIWSTSGQIRKQLSRLDHKHSWKPVASLARSPSLCPDGPTFAQLFWHEI